MFINLILCEDILLLGFISFNDCGFWFETSLNFFYKKQSNLVCQSNLCSVCRCPALGVA